jgi:lysophospholipase L1-like esterase
MLRLRSTWFLSLPKASIALMLIVCALMYAPFSALGTPHSALAQGAGPALLLGVGDSLMAGVGASLPDERGEFALVADLMQGRFGPNLRTVNVAVPGETSATFLAPKQPAPPASGSSDPTPVPIRAQMLRALDELGRLPAGQQAMILASIGGNDLQALAGRDNAAREATLATFRTNLAQIVTRLTEGGQTRALFIQTIYDPFGGDPTAVGSDAWWVERFNSVIRDVAATNPLVTVVDLAAQVRGKEQALTLGRFDDVHLSNAGHRLAADLYWATSGFDRTGPAIKLDAPQSGNAPRPVLTIRATVIDDSGPNGVARVVLLADGAEQGTLMPRPDLGLNVYLGVWDGRLLPGPHRIGVAATDRAGNRVESVADVTVGQ